jgi:hypothetical protein
MIDSLTALKKSKIKCQLFKGGRPESKSFYIYACKAAIDKVIIFKTVSTRTYKSKLKLIDLDIPANSSKDNISENSILKILPH